MSNKRIADMTPEELERKRAYRREWSRRNKEHLRAYQKRWKLKNRDHVLAYNRKYNKSRDRSTTPGRSAGDATLVHLRCSLMSNETYRAVWDALPNNMKRITREEVAAEAVILLLEGTAKTPAEAVKLGRDNYFRLFSKFGVVSMDEPIFEKRTLHDVLSSDSLA